ncbi:MAG: hypothetical protein WCT05_01260 [Lentisphaeria bacterium]
MVIELSEKQIKEGWQIIKFGKIAKEVQSITQALLRHKRMEAKI